jgi:hypothetical protein
LHSPETMGAVSEKFMPRPLPSFSSIDPAITCPDTCPVNIGRVALLKCYSIICAVCVLRAMIYWAAPGPQEVKHRRLRVLNLAMHPDRHGCSPSPRKIISSRGRRRLVIGAATVRLDRHLHHNSPTTEPVLTLCLNQCEIFSLEMRKRSPDVHDSRLIFSLNSGSVL